MLISRRADILDLMSLYLKYRPKTIEELDLSSVRKALGEMIAGNKLSHAYLLTGPRGAGKTSTARIIARIVNCEHNKEKLGEPCNECDSCKSILDGRAVDVIEMDAASNRGIDDIRELKEKIRLSPARLAKKVYIIDEVHMLTTEAFNALLKTLEEPPSHSLFILCTTELHKVPETIVSRCVQLKFAKANPAELARSFARVIAGEGREVSEDALLYLAKMVDGSFRDGVKLLEQVLIAPGKIELKQMEEVIVGRGGGKMEELIEALGAKDVATTLGLVAQVLGEGMDLNYLLLGLMRGLRDRLLAGGVGVEVTQLIFSLDEVARRSASALDGELLLQVAIVEWCGVQMQVTDSGKGKKSKELEKSSGERIDEQPVKLQGINPSNVWQELLGSLNGDSITLGALLAKAVPMRLAGDELVIGVAYDFHRQQLMSEKTLVKLEKAVERIVGNPIKIRCEVVEKVGRVGDQKTESKASEDDIIDQAVEIFSS